MGGSFTRIFGRQFYEDIWEAVLGGYFGGNFMWIFGRQFYKDIWEANV